MNKKISVSATFSQALTLYSDNFFPLLKLSLIGGVPAIISMISLSVAGEGAVDTGALLFWLLSSGLSTITAIAMVRQVQSLSGTGIVLPFPEVLRTGMERFWAFYGAYLLTALLWLSVIMLSALVMLFGISIKSDAAMFYGGLLFIFVSIPCTFIFSAVCSFFPFILLQEKVGVWTALGESWVLAFGNWSKVFVALLFIFLVCLAAALPLGIGLKMLGASKVVLDACAQAIMVVMFPLMVAYMFYIFQALKENDTKVPIAVYEAGTTTQHS